MVILRFIFIYAALLFMFFIGRKNVDFVEINLQTRINLFMAENRVVFNVKSASWWHLYTTHEVIFKLKATRTRIPLHIQEMQGNQHITPTHYKDEFNVRKCIVTPSSVE